METPFHDLGVSRNRDRAAARTMVSAVCVRRSPGNRSAGGSRVRAEGTPLSPHGFGPWNFRQSIVNVFETGPSSACVAVNDCCIQAQRR